jgi:membrane associated rhomboid family serine protease
VTRPGLRATLIVGVIVATWWVVEIVDVYALDDRLQTNGIRPRQLDGLDGVLWAPFLHSDFGHLISNTFPFIALSALVLIGGLRHWLVITALGLFLGGLATWLFASDGNHIGASGVVFTYFGVLLAAAGFERRPAAMAPALVTLLLYATMLAGLVPQDRISWEGHLAGFSTGILAAGVGAWFKPRPKRKDRAEPEVSAVFGGEEPWLD